MLRVLDQWSRQSPTGGGDPYFGVTGGQAFDRVWDGVRGRDLSFFVAHETKFESRALEDWAYRRWMYELDFILPSKPVGKAFIEGISGRLRDECLNVHRFTSMAEAQHIIEAWRLDYNQRRSHSSLGHLTPNDFVGQRQALQTAEAVLCSRAC